MVGFGEAEGMGEREACLPSGTALDSETWFYSHHENYHLPLLAWGRHYADDPSQVAILDRGVAQKAM